jgi:hypothetical protein
MAKKIRFPLEMKDGVQARTLDELIQNFDLERILSYVEDGRLETWLRDRYYGDMADRVKEIEGRDNKAAETVCGILGLPAAFSQDALYDLLDQDAETIYLYGEKFEIPVQKTNVTYIGLNKPELVFHSPEPVDWAKRNITVLNCVCGDYDAMMKYQEKEPECRKLYESMKKQQPEAEYRSFEELYGAAKEICRLLSGKKQGEA